MTTLESTTERLEEALRRLAVEAADLLEELLASGAELPFDLEPSDEGPLPMYSYAPLTGQFIEWHQAELRRLEAFVEVREIAGEEAAIGFMVGLWDGKTEFEIAGDRLQGAIDGVLAMISSDSDEATPAGEVIVPLVGFHMPKDEIVLDGVRIVRADLVPDAPVDAVESTRAGKGKPGFLAGVSCNLAAVAPAAAVADDLRRALRTLRLFRPGAVGLASHGWAKRTGGWERFGTGADRPRQGGYRLTGNEIGDLEAFSRTLAERGSRLPALDWAASRFELGAERSSLIEALSDYLLALRGLLEGGGPNRTSLSARVAALACEPGADREQGRICVERALTLERKLMSGARYRPTPGASPLDVIAELEELLRRLLKGLATGELRGDLRAAADEVLLSEGLSASYVDAPDFGQTAEWRIPDPTPGDGLDLSAVSDGNLGEAEIEVRKPDVDAERATDFPEPPIDVPEFAVDASEPDQPDGTETNEIADLSVRGGEEDRHTTTRIVVDEVELPEITGEVMGGESDDRGAPESELDFGGRADWFGAAGGEPEWPAFASPRRKRDHRREPTKDRVRYLFPVPDATDWSVGELRYDRKAR